MILLLLCILVNAFIVVIFNYFGKYNVKNFQAIVINYFVCVIVGSVIMGEPAVTLEIIDKPWFFAAVFLGVIFTLVFNVVALTVQKFGLTITSIFQKMSLLAPAIIAMTFFNEAATVLKILGIIVSVLAIVVLSLRRGAKLEGYDSKSWIFPLLTFVGSSVIDSSLYIVDETGLASSGDIGFLSSLFFTAAVSGAIIWAVRHDYSQPFVEKKSIIAGIGLGIPNFFSIYLLLLVLDQGLGGSVVFPINNVGILACSALFGLILFQEKFDRKKIIGFVLAVLSIILIANG